MAIGAGALLLGWLKLNVGFGDLGTVGIIGCTVAALIVWRARQRFLPETVPAPSQRRRGWLAWLSAVLVGLALIAGLLGLAELRTDPLAGGARLGLAGLLGLLGFVADRRSRRPRAPRSGE